MDGQMSIFDFPQWIPGSDGFEPKEVDIRGICDDGYCPDCNCALDDLAPTCPECGCILDWTRWKVMNEA